MGYRELLKNYIRYLELQVGDNFIESIPAARERILSDRDLGELRAIAAEVFREGSEQPQRSGVANYNYRFRLLLNHYGIPIRTAAILAGSSEDRVRRWRTQPRSRRYLAMTGAEFLAFEGHLRTFLETGSLPPEVSGQAARDAEQTGQRSSRTAAAGHAERPASGN